MKKFLLIFCCIGLVGLVSAQKPPVKWGKVDDADLQMTSYPGDPEAEAAVLMDYATINFNFEGLTHYVMDHHVRIKVFKESAFDRGDIEIAYYSDNNVEEIITLKAQVILPDGEIIKLGKKDFFTEKINEYWSRKKFAMPSLQEGAIIEYRYVKTSNSIYDLTDWYFQTDIPTRHSEFRTNIPEWYGYVSFTQGETPETERSSQVESIRFDDRNNSVRTQSGLISVQVNKKRYVMEDVPALKPERFITTMSDYYSKISFQLQFVNFPNSLPEPVNNTWEKISEGLKKSDSFGDQIYKTRHTKKIMEAVRPLVASVTDPYEKLMIVYSFINSNVEWNELSSIYAKESLDDAFESKLANSGEMNLMLVAICHQLGLETYPVLISTRSHGRMLELYPKTDQFNHVLAYVKTGDNEHLLDVGSEHRSAKYLRANSLNYRGWLVNGPQSTWIDVAVPADVGKMIVNADLSADGTLTGSIQEICAGYTAMESRYEYYENMEKDHEHILANWQESFPDAKVSNVAFANPEKTNESFKSSLDIELPNAAQINDNFIYLSPMLGNGYEENPLKLENRTFPVDMPYKIKEQYVIILTIPEGYAVEELPEAALVKLPAGGGIFRYLVSEKNGTVQITSKIDIKQNRYQPGEYPSIRQFYDLIVEKHGEQIVLKKTS